ncbi:MAG: ABC transporter ATP-binding protein [Candidatus Izemoplasmatales bacterium]|jgi:putative ABC transport system ATP-binding protein|nr:ABC transporter ATP-binding protein [Candidatus Izemoplasmatales bacterium]
MVLIDAREVNKDYHNGEVMTHVLKNLSLCVSEGDFCGIVGPSGSGKSTLLYVLSGLEPPTSGSILLTGKDLSHISETEMADLRQKTIGFVFQFYNLIPNLTVYENLLLPMIIAKDHQPKRIEEALEAVGLIEAMHQYPNQLSGGMQQRVAIARAIINRPKLIFADEPTGNLDQKSGIEVMNLLQKLNHEYKITIILVTHNLEHIHYCTRKIELCDGMIVSDEQRTL